MSAIDIALDMLRSEVGVYAPYEPDPVETARAELSSLRQRVEDLERLVPLARAAMNRMECDCQDEVGLLTADIDMSNAFEALTPEAREELRKR